MKISTKNTKIFAKKCCYRLCNIEQYKYLKHICNIESILSRNQKKKM